MDKLDLQATTDAAVWASEFNQTAQRLGYSPMDEGWLIGWFANAMLAKEMAIRRAKEVRDDGPEVCPLNTNENIKSICEGCRRCFGGV